MPNTLEGTAIEPDIREGQLVVRVKNTTASELLRIHRVLSEMFDQGIFNVKVGTIKLAFDEDGELMQIALDALKWRKGKNIVNRVSLFDSAIVEIKGNDVE